MGGLCLLGQYRALHPILTTQGRLQTLAARLDERVAAKQELSAGSGEGTRRLTPNPLRLYRRRVCVAFEAWPRQSGPKHRFDERYLCSDTTCGARALRSHSRATLPITESWCTARRTC